jgi:hypothetical protein
VRGATLGNLSYREVEMPVEFQRNSFPGTKRRVNGRPPNAVRATVEPLEDRRLLSAGPMTVNYYQVEVAPLPDYLPPGYTVSPPSGLLDAVPKIPVLGPPGGLQVNQPSSSKTANPVIGPPGGLQVIPPSNPNTPVTVNYYQVEIAPLPDYLPSGYTVSPPGGLLLDGSAKTPIVGPPAGLLNSAGMDTVLD